MLSAARRRGSQRIYNGLDLAQFPYSTPRDRDPVMVGVGRLIEKKGFEDLVAACAILARQGRSFACEIIGPGPLQADLREQVDTLNLGDHVRFCGPLPQETSSSASAAPQSSPRRASSAQTVTATACPRFCSKRWHSARRASRPT